MQHREDTLAGAAGHSIYFQYWMPEQAPRALLLVVHGAGEHSARYAELAELTDASQHPIIRDATAALMATKRAVAHVGWIISTLRNWQQTPRRP